MYRDIKERTFEFSIQIVRLAGEFPETREGRILCNQVLRSGTSIGANVEEGVASYSRHEFGFKMNIALKEARETSYWLRLAGSSDILAPTRLNDLLKETEELKKILGSIVSRVRGKSKKHI